MLVLISSITIAQTDTCVSNLKNAGTDYDQGNYDQAISTLNFTLKGCDLTKQDQIAANKLLILCYLSIDNLEAANSTADAILKIDPTYTPDKFKDDPRLSSLFEKYKPEPTLVVGISGGINWPSIDVEKTYSVVHPDDSPNLGTYESNLRYQLGADIEKRVYQDLWIALEFQYRKTSYQHILNDVQGTTINYTENINYADVPLSVKYFFLQHQITPYVQAGADFSWLLQALSTTTRDEASDLVGRTDMRTSFMVGFLGAAGVKYSIRSFGAFVDFRYIYFPELVNKEGTRYADEINLYKYYYVDDDFSMNNLQINIGLTYVLDYSVRKIK